MAITATEMRRDNRAGGVEVLLKFEDDSNNRVSYKIFRYNNEAEIIDQQAGRIDRAKFNIDVKRSFLNDFDIGRGSVEILEKAITAIRANPDLTKTQAINWFNNNYPNVIWKAEAFIDNLCEFLLKELGFVPTWDQFKNYVINNKFAWVDHYEG